MNPPDRQNLETRRLDAWSKDAHNAWQGAGHLSSTQAIFTHEMPKRFSPHYLEEFGEDYPLADDQRVTAAPASLLPQGKVHTFQHGVYEPNVDAIRREIQTNRFIDRGSKNAWATVDDSGRTWLRNGHHRAAAAHLENSPMPINVYNPRERVIKSWINDPHRNVNSAQISHNLRNMHD